MLVDVYVPPHPLPTLTVLTPHHEAVVLPIGLGPAKVQRISTRPGALGHLAGWGAELLLRFPKLLIRVHWWKLKESTQHQTSLGKQ